MCEFTFETVADLDLYFKACEFNECGKCCIRDKKLNEMRKLADSTQISYIKMDRNNDSEVSEKYYCFSEL